MEKDFDVVIYGATGFTGQLVVKYFSSINTEVNWAIAGRNKTKLEEVAGKFAEGVEILIADSDDEQALDSITSRTKVILSTAGPFYRYGSKLVASCVKNSSHYVDITGENFWVKGLIDKHHQEASSKGIRIIPSCGYDSIPSDLGTFYAVSQTNKPVKRVESFHAMKGGASGGTLETMFSMGSLGLGKEMQDPFLLNPKNSYTEEQKSFSSDKVGLAEKKEIASWSAPFIMAMANTRVVRRSAAIYAERQEPYGGSFTYQEHGIHENRWSAIKSLISTIIGGVVLMTPLKYLVKPFLPKPGEGPSEEVQENGFFDCKYIVETEDGEKVVYRMYAKGDPGYRVTSKLVSECALSLVENLDELPGGREFGGVLTSASGLGKPLINRLSKVGVLFEGPLQKS